MADALGVEVFRLFVDDGESAATSAALEVPFGRDGSYFSPTTLRPKTKEFNVGDKGRGNTKRFKRFDDALAYLHAQRAAKKSVEWWRPDNRGHWGLVTAVRWAGLPTDEAAH